MRVHVASACLLPFLLILILPSLLLVDKGEFDLTMSAAINDLGRDGWSEHADRLSIGGVTVFISRCTQCDQMLGHLFLSQAYQSGTCCIVANYVWRFACLGIVVSAQGAWEKMLKEERSIRGGGGTSQSRWEMREPIFSWTWSELKREAPHVLGLNHPGRSVKDEVY